MVTTIDYPSDPHNDNAENLLSHITIPPCPKVVLALVGESRSDVPDFDKLDRLISGDVAMAGAVLQSANSPYYGVSRKVISVKQALAVLGLRTVTNIVSMLALRKALDVGVSLERFWDRTNYHAIACARLARYLKMASPEGAYTFGLFNDCGIPILAARYPDYKQTLSEANDAVRPFLGTEQGRYGTNHAVVGALLAKAWHLPPIICNAIRDHHALELLYSSPLDIDTESIYLRCISMLADYIVNRFLEVRQEAEWNIHGVQALHRLGLYETDLDVIFSQVSDDLVAAKRFRG